ncbi:TonB-dependent receptor [Sphingobium sp. CR2-8]|uniref:TonB-dependent receptor n=1 Tax=Sphingobium sp. CR2-8 TaxID=1306534 RepID=UPI002DBBCD8F|nr:TonB-dependent receptor [Sphingobium sp. CR2-8]MEC3909158.1 TonB-dependent receptor [Sphingobium sp. CR2-8]
MIRFSVSSLLAISVATGATIASAQAEVRSQQVAVRIAASSLDQGLNQFIVQTRQQILYSPGLVRGKRARPVSGRYSPDQALSILLQGSGLRGLRTPGGAFVLEAEQGRGQENAAGVGTVSERVSQEAPAPADIVVTGTLSARAPVSVAVSTLDAATLQQSVPASAADLLRNVPGVFVNSALGEVRNIVYSRGISANSTEAATGYYYVSMQEDGLPVTNVTFNNYTPDFFYRQDLSLERLEALRGGTAVVTGPNAPGGIFNYISKTGRDSPGLEMRTRLGLEGDGRNPYYRFDARAGGQIGENALYYSVSGFYRYNKGARDNAYPMNRGGQVKANLLWDYGDGSILLYGKYQDDHNAFYEFQPGRDFSNPRLAQGISRYDSFLIPASPHNYVETVNGPTKQWNGRNVVHATAKVLGLKFDHNFDSGWTVRNNFKVNWNKADYDSSALAFALPITDGFTNTLLNTSANGVYSYRDVVTGQLLAQVRNANGARTVLLNNLPNQQVLQNAIITQTAFNYNPRVREIMDQFSISKKLDRGSITLGAFFSDANVNQYGGGAGFGVSTLQNQPHMLNITLTTPNGAVQQVTTADGFAGIGQRFAGTPFRGKQRQFSVFGGADYEVVDGLTLEGALRYEYIRNKGSNDVAIANPQSGSSSYGGLDGNVDTLYDNFAVTYQAPYEYRFNLDFLSFSTAATYKFDESNSVYVRYSQGKKAPDLGFFTTYDTLAELQNVTPIPQKIQQIEAGYRFRRDWVRATLTPFYSKLSNVGTTAFGSNPDGTSYVPAPLLSQTMTYGVEVEADADLVDRLNLRVALTLQKSKSKDFATYNFGAPGPADDTIIRVPNGKADNAAEIMSTSTLRYSPTDTFSTFLTWRYLGKRPANRYNAFNLPAYHEVDFGLNWNLSENLSVGANVNNLFNSKGVLSWAPSGALLTALNRQTLTPAAVAANPAAPFNILLNQPRAFFVTLGAKF